MSEFGITKIMDGIFISDSSLIMDPQFLITNKVISVIGWSQNAVPLNLQQEGINSIEFQFGIDSTQQTKFEPKLLNQKQLLEIFDFIQKAKQQYLCSLVYSDYQSEAGIIVCSYVMKKFLWDMNTSLNFIQLRFPNFSPKDSLIQGLSQYETFLTQKYGIKLKSLQFSLKFLRGYKPEDTDQLLLINTIKNTLQIQIQSLQQKKKSCGHKSRRIQWFDKVRPCSSTGSYNKFALYNRGSSLKQSKLSNSSVISINSTLQNNWNTIDLNNKSFKPKEKTLLLQANNKYLKRSSDSNFTLGEYFMQDLQYQSLKQLSRTNFNDPKMKGHLKKRGSLKFSKQNNSKEKLNNQNHRPSSGSKLGMKSEKIDSQKFLLNLKSMSKNQHENLGINA